MQMKVTKEFCRVCDEIYSICAVSMLIWSERRLNSEVIKLEVDTKVFRLAEKEPCCKELWKDLRYPSDQTVK